MLFEAKYNLILFLESAVNIELHDMLKSEEKVRDEYGKFALKICLCLLCTALILCKIHDGSSAQFHQRLYCICKVKKL